MGDGEDEVVASLFQQRLIGDRARGDDAHHLALHRALAGGRVADLLADGHRFAKTDEPCQVSLHGMVGHSGHRDWLACRGTASGQGNVQ